LPPLGEFGMDDEEETLAGTGVEETGPEEAGCVEPGIVDTASVVNGEQTEDKTVANDCMGPPVSWRADR
jgi:hypothetical protein